MTIYRIRVKFDGTDLAANAPKSDHPRMSITEENETRVVMIFVNSPKKYTQRVGKNVFATVNA